MADFKDFDAARAERERANKPIRFRLGGEEFTMLPRPTLFDVFELAAAPDPRDAELDPSLLSASVKAIADFVERMIADKRAQARWRKLLARRTDVIDSESIIELGEWLAQEYTGRPLEPSSDSADGRRSNGVPTNTQRFAPESGSQT